MTSFSAPGEETIFPKRPAPFMGDDYFHSLALRAERARIYDRIVTTHLGSTMLGPAITKTMSPEVATRINALTILKLAHAAKSWKSTRDRLAREKEYSSTWTGFQEQFLLHAGQTENVRVVQIGSYDGVTHDRLNPLLMDHPEWTAVLVEPMPKAFEGLKKTYKGRPNTTLVNAAVTDVDGSVNMFYIEPDERTPLYIDLTATTQPPTLSSFLEAGREIETEPVKSSTYDSLIRDNNLTGDLDLLFIDAEGCDYAILKTALSRGDLPHFIVAEHDHMSAEGYAESVKALATSGYDVRIIAHDILASRTTSLL